MDQCRICIPKSFKSKTEESIIFCQYITEETLVLSIMHISGDVVSVSQIFYTNKMNSSTNIVSIMQKVINYNNNRGYLTLKGI